MKTIREINEKIGKGKVVAVTAEEVIDLVQKKGTRQAAEEVDVVTVEVSPYDLTRGRIVYRYK